MTAETVDARRPDEVIGILGSASELLRQNPYRKGALVHLPARGRLVISGDLHDNPVHFEKITRFARLSHSEDTHLVLQELIHSERLINGVDLSYRVLVRVAELIAAHPTQVHPVLANHELSQMTGAGVSKGAGNSVELFDAGLEFVFHDRWEEVEDAIHEFIRSMPLAVRSESGVFCAHSLPGPRMMKFFDRAVLSRDLDDADYAGPEGAAYLMTWGRLHTDEQIEELATEWQVDTFYLGHEHVDTGVQFSGPRLVKLNSDHEHGALLDIDLVSPATAEDAVMNAVYLNGLP